MVRYGFTGTQRGMTEEQKHILRRWLASGRGDEFHHGDCVGADAEAHDIAAERGLTISVHPPENSAKRAYRVGTFMAKPKPYLDRNKDIVNDSDILIAMPGESEEQLRSGTWSTVRFAKKKLKLVDIVFPDGTYTMWRSS